jgi:hypothetical protein
MFQQLFLIIVKDLTSKNKNPEISGKTTAILLRKINGSVTTSAASVSLLLSLRPQRK